MNNMVAMRNATITSTVLGVEDHGILAMSIILDFGGYCQGYVREVTQEGLRDVLQVTGVDSWEKLRGRNVRASIEGGTIRALGHIVRDEWTDRETVGGK